jgi:5-methylcytosine-specific restriction endonuclease McrA
MGSTPFRYPRIEIDLKLVWMMTLNVLERPTLVLNRNWQPVNVATVARALVLLWNEAARVVDVADYQMFTWNDWSKLRPEGDEAFVQATSMRLRVPEVIALSSYDHMPASAVTFSRRNIFKRDHYVCQYCGNQPGTDELTIDHVVPRAKGGVSNWTNCVLACVTCNKRKADRAPRDAGMMLRRQPIRPTWKPVYADHHVRLESWSKFISDMYWNAELEK